MKRHEEEFRQLIKVIPTDELSAIRLAYTIEAYRERYPASFDRVMREEAAKLLKEKQNAHISG